MNTLGLSLGTVAALRWWPAAAIYAADFVNDRYMINGVPVAAPAAFNVLRAGTKLAENTAGIWSSFGVDVPARTDRGLSIEPEQEYQALNAALEGTVAGVIGSGGVRPTGWASGTPVGLTLEILGTAQAGALSYIRVRISGVSTGTDFQWMFDNSTVVATAGQTWTGSLLVRLVAGSIAGISPALRLVEQNGSTFLNSSQTSMSLTNRFSQTVVTRTFDGATTNRARPRLRLLLDSVGQNVDLTLDLACPCLFQAAAATSPYLSTQASATRAADHLWVNTPAQTRTLISVFSSSSDEIRTISGGSYEHPLTRPLSLITTVVGLAT